MDALHLVQPTGNVIAIDPLRTRIEVARKLHPDLPGLELRQEGAETLVRHPDDRYDAVYLNDVLQWLPAPGSTLKEVYRILKPHGRIGLQGCFLESCTPFLDEPPFNAHPPTEFPGARQWLAIEATLASLGFRQTSLALGRSRLCFADGNAAIAFMEASSFNNWLSHLPPVLRALARQRQLLELERKRTPEGISLETTSIQVVAVKPPPGPEALFRWRDLPIRRLFHAPRAVWAGLLMRPTP